MKAICRHLEHGVGSFPATEARPHTTRAGAECWPWNRE